MSYEGSSKVSILKQIEDLKLRRDYDSAVAILKQIPAEVLNMEDVFDADGKPVCETDQDGNPIQDTDENGEPLYEDFATDQTYEKT